MAKRRTSRKTEYDVYYDIENNAALQPKYAPKRERKVTRKSSPQEDEKNLRLAHVVTFVRCCALFICCVAMGFFVVSRNAQVYRNTTEIKALAKEKSTIELKIRTAEKDCSVGSELNSYFEIAENQLALSYPEDNDIIKVSCTVAKEDASEAQESGNIYDTVLDWFGSLERRIKNWA